MKMTELLHYTKSLLSGVSISCSIIHFVLYTYKILKDLQLQFWDKKRKKVKIRMNQISKRNKHNSLFITCNYKLFLVR